MAGIYTKRREKMFHESNIGYASIPSDMDGYVGERGDKFEDFNFDLEGDLNDPEDYDYYVNEWFPTWIEECVRATEDARESIDGGV